MSSGTPPHRIGIVGLGTVGARFVEQFNRHAQFDLVAAWDADPAACAAYADAAPVVADAAAVIEAADAVYIAVPPLHHAGYVHACLAAGVGVFCEKPLGVDLGESRGLVAAVEASGLPAGVNFVFSAAPSATELLRTAASGELGPLIRADLRLHMALWPRAWHVKAQWLRLRDQGGWMREVVSHFLFLAERLLGPLSVQAATVSYPDGPGGELSEVDALARFVAADGTPLVMLGTSEGPGPDVVDLTVRGETGSIRLTDWYRLETASGSTATPAWQALSAGDRASLGADAYATQLDQLSLMLQGKPSTIATFAEALSVQELIETCLTS